MYFYSSIKIFEQLEEDNNSWIKHQNKANNGYATQYQVIIFALLFFFLSSLLLRRQLTLPVSHVKQFFNIFIFLVYFYFSIFFSFLVWGSEGFYSG